MCTWLVIESINHYSRNNNDVYSCFMDMKKAFDTVKHGLHFRKMVERNLPSIYLRLLLVMYMAQTAKVRWDGTISDAFSVLNGVKQRAVLSAILFCVYINDLIKLRTGRMLAKWCLCRHHRVRRRHRAAFTVHRWPAKHDRHVLKVCWKSQLDVQHTREPVKKQDQMHGVSTKEERAQISQSMWQVTSLGRICETPWNNHHQHDRPGIRPRHTWEESNVHS